MARFDLLLFFVPVSFCCSWHNNKLQQHYRRQQQLHIRCWSLKRSWQTMSEREKLALYLCGLF